MTDYDFSSILNPSTFYRITSCKTQKWNSTGFSYLSKMRPDHGFLFVTKGHIRFDFENQPLIASPGDLIFLPKGIYYEACIPPEYGDTEDYLINFDSDTLTTETGPRHPVRILHTDQHELPDHFNKIINDSQSLHYSDFYFTGQFYILLDKISNELRDQSSKQKTLIHHVRDLLTDQPELSIGDVADLYNISESGLRSQFKKAYGLSPKQYQMNIKINRAKYLLEATNLSVYDIAEASGFYDEAYFCKVFRCHTGISPRMYARKKAI